MMQVALSCLIGVIRCERDGGDDPDDFDAEKHA